VTDIEFDEEPDISWNGIKDEAFNEMSDLLALSEAMQKRWLEL